MITRCLLGGPLCLVAAALAGCTLWPFGAKEHTSIITPSMRAASIREMGPRARDADLADQARMCEQLAQQIQTEPDPIVRKTIQETIAEFQTPLAATVLIAGLNDEDREVRIACCRKLGERQDANAVGPLSRLVSTDEDLDVRLAAVDALSQLKSEAAIPGLAAALKDRDPAMQLAGVEAMRNVTGEKLGNDVAAWREYASRAMSDGAAISVAEQPSASPAATQQR
jgi:HEAT repeat protein